jgi:NAD-dependent dihydropyrimidine dehydrogenase PreA subunit
MIATPLPPRVVVYEGSGARPLPTSDRGHLVAALLDRGYAVTLAGASAATARPDGGFIVVGCFDGQEPEVDGGTVTVCDMTGATVEATVQKIEAARGDRQMNRPDAGAASGAGDATTWKPWFPVIDPVRCTNCMQCLSFCLFDVYGVSSDHRLVVENPANCKVNCPACSRVCPDVAIMFPKYHAGPIDGGPVSDADVTREKMKVDISALLGGDIYAKLRERSDEAKKRYSRERSADQALAERRRCLTKLADASAIPREVLDALPSPEEIRQRAEVAAARAAAALAEREAAP